jgi:hypothetical protein
MGDNTENEVKMEEPRIKRESPVRDLGVSTPKPSVSAQSESSTPPASPTVETNGVNTDSRKRSIPDNDGRATSTEPQLKRQKTSEPREDTPTPVSQQVTVPAASTASNMEGTPGPAVVHDPMDLDEAPSQSAFASWGDMITAVPYTGHLFADEPTELLERSVALALNHVGFDGATKEALSAFCSQASAFAERFLSYITESMLASRRSQPIPLDYEYAMRRQGFTSKHLRPHLKPPVPKSRTQLSFELMEAEAEEYNTAPELLGNELSGENDKLTKPFVPKNFPAFPSKHTYKATGVLPDRETDPRRIREKATEAARQGEEALRRLVSIGKGGDSKDVRKAITKNAEKKYKHELWEKAMAEFEANGQPDSAKADQEGFKKGILINCERRYGRKPVSRAGA